MPHLTVEYSHNLSGFPETQLLAELNAAVTSSPEIADEADLKSRVLRVQQFAVGTAPDQRAFVHAQLRLLSGDRPRPRPICPSALPPCCASARPAPRACWCN